MNKDQLLEKSLQALIKIKASSEYCLFNAFDSDLWCMTKSEWSSWMQAIGVIVSLLIAIFLPKLDAMRSRAENIKLAKVAVMQLCSVIDALQLAMVRAPNIKAGFLAEKEEVETVQNFLREVRTHELPTCAIDVWHSILATSESLSRLENNVGPPDGAKILIVRKRSKVEHLLSEFEKRTEAGWIARSNNRGS